MQCYSVLALHCCVSSAEYGVFDAKCHDDIPGVTAKHYTVTVISGQSLPKPGSAEGEIIDPYVRLEVHGLGADEKDFK